MQILGCPAILILQLLVGTSISRSDLHNSTFAVSRSLSIERKETVRVVVYDKIKGYLNWLNPWFIEAAEKQCSTKCILSDKPQDLNNADVVVFHAPTHGQQDPRRPQKRSQGSIYALVSLEQPGYAHILNDPIQLKTFDILMTYSLKPFYGNSNIPNMPITYYPLHILSTNAVLQPPRPFQMKSGYNTGKGI